MWGRSTKQRRAAARRRHMDRDLQTALAVAAFGKAMDECRSDVIRAVAENVARNNTLLRSLRTGSRFVCELPRDGFMQKPPKGVC